MSIEIDEETQKAKNPESISKNTPLRLVFSIVAAAGVVIGLMTLYKMISVL